MSPLPGLRSRGVSWFQRARGKVDLATRERCAMEDALGRRGSPCGDERKPMLGQKAEGCWRAEGRNSGWPGAARQPQVVEAPLESNKVSALGLPWQDATNWASQSTAGLSLRERLFQPGFCLWVCVGDQIPAAIHTPSNFPVSLSFLYTDVSPVFLLPSGITKCHRPPIFNTEMYFAQFKREIVKSKGWGAVPDDNSEHSGSYHMTTQWVCVMCSGISVREGHFWFTITVCRPSLSPYKATSSCLHQASIEGWQQTPLPTNSPCWP